MSKPTNKSIYLEGMNSEGQKFWLRIYHRGSVDVYLTSFVPTADNGLLPELEKLVTIKEITRWKEAGMSVMIADKAAGVRVNDLIELLKKIKYTGKLYEVRLSNGKELD